MDRVENKINNLKIIKYITALFSIVYVLIWVMQFINKQFYSVLNSTIGILAAFLDDFFDISIQLKDLKVNMGELYIVLIASCFAVFAITSLKTLGADENVQKIKKQNVQNNKKNTTNNSKPIKKVKDVQIAIPIKSTLPKEDQEAQEISGKFKDFIERERHKQELLNNLKKVDKLQEENKQKEIESERQKIQKKSIEKDRKIELRFKQEVPRIPTISIFHGLIEFDLRTFEENELIEKNINLLKKQYSKMLADKLQERFQDVYFRSTDKIFITCGDFNLFDEIIDSISKLMLIFRTIDDVNRIDTRLLVSFYADRDDVEIKNIMLNLFKINELKLYNQIILSRAMSYKYSKNIKKKYEVLYFEHKKEEQIGFEIFRLNKKIV